MWKLQKSSKPKIEATNLWSVRNVIKLRIIPINYIFTDITGNNLIPVSIKIFYLQHLSISK